MKKYTVTMKFKRETTGDYFDFLYEGKNKKETAQMARKDHPCCTVVAVERELTACKSHEF